MYRTVLYLPSIELGGPKVRRLQHKASWRYEARELWAVLEPQLKPREKVVAKYSRTYPVLILTLEDLEMWLERERGPVLKCEGYYAVSTKRPLEILINMEP